MTKKPLIAVTGSSDEKLFSADWWSWLCIYLAVWLAGGHPRRYTPKTSPFVFDGLLLAGGADINSELYGQANTHCHRCQPDRDELELRLLKAMLAEKKPVLGICRGAQMINIGKGGTLHQEASKAFRYYTPSKTVFEKIFKRKRSYVSGSRWLNNQIFDENEKQFITSLHHQAIDKLGENLIRIADDHHGMTQAIEENSENFVVGLQWHPELQLGSWKQRGIFRLFVKACAENMQKTR